MSSSSIQLFLEKAFEFLRDREFTINRETWQNFCNQQGVSQKTLNLAKIELSKQIQKTTNNFEKIKYLEQLFCCDPFEIDNVKTLRNNWHEQGEIEPEPFQRWSYEISIHLLQLTAETPTEPTQPIPKANVNIPEKLSLQENSTLEKRSNKQKINPFILIIFPIIIISFVLGNLVSSYWRNQSNLNTNKQINHNQTNVKIPNDGIRTSMPAYLPNFPLATCGDRDPAGINTWYPVFVENSNENLFLIRRDYCKDAFRNFRQEKGITSIQVASFLNTEKAQHFAEIMRNQIGNAEVGQPTVH